MYWKSLGILLCAEHVRVASAFQNCTLVNCFFIRLRRPCVVNKTASDTATKMFKSREGRCSAQV